MTKKLYWATLIKTRKKTPRGLLFTNYGSFFINRVYLKRCTFAHSILDKTNNYDKQ